VNSVLSLKQGLILWEWEERKEEEENRFLFAVILGCWGCWVKELDSSYIRTELELKRSVGPDIK